MPDTAAKQMNRCGGEMTVPDLVSQFWSKTNPGRSTEPTGFRGARSTEQKPSEAAKGSAATAMSAICRLGQRRT